MPLQLFELWRVFQDFFGKIAQTAENQGLRSCYYRHFSALKNLGTLFCRAVSGLSKDWYFGSNLPLMFVSDLMHSKCVNSSVSYFRSVQWMKLEFKKRCRHQFCIGWRNEFRILRRNTCLEQTIYIFQANYWRVNIPCNTIPSGFFLIVSYSESRSPGGCDQCHCYLSFLPVWFSCRRGARCVLFMMLKL